MALDSIDLLKRKSRQKFVAVFIVELLLFLTACGSSSCFLALEKAECVYIYRFAECEPEPEMYFLTDSDAIWTLCSALEEGVGGELASGAGETDGGEVLSLLVIRDGAVVLRLGCTVSMPVLRVSTPPRGVTGVINWQDPLEDWSFHSYYFPGVDAVFQAALDAAEPAE